MPVTDFYEENIIRAITFFHEHLLIALQNLEDFLPPPLQKKVAPATMYERSRKRMLDRSAVMSC